MYSDEEMMCDKLDPMEETDTMLDNDEISAEEEGFMMGYKDACEFKNRPEEFLVEDDI